MPTRKRIVEADVPRDLRCHAQAETPSPHLAEGHGSTAAIRPILHAVLATADLLDRARQIAVPLERVHRQIEVRVKNEHGLRSGHWRSGRGTTRPPKTPFRARSTSQASARRSG